MKKELMYLIAAGLLLTSCNETDLLETSPIETSVQRVASVSTADYSVTRQMLDKYLHVTHKSDSMESIVPIVKDRDTLAYCVNYSKGWALISADQRMPPVLAFSDEGVLNLLDAENPAIMSLQGLIDRVATIKASSETHCDPIWSLLDGRSQNNSTNTNKVKRRAAYGSGIWVATDSSYESSRDEISHIIRTNWSQRAPYNKYIVFRQTDANTWNQAPTGCMPIACGQIIAHYRANNNLGTTLPLEAHRPEAGNNQFSVTSFSTEGWRTIFSSYDTQAMFLAYLGLIMGTQYTWDSGATDKGQESKAFDEYKLSFSKTESYDFNTVMSNLKSGVPIYAAAYMTDTANAPYKHVFIIDGAKINEDKRVMTYEWDATHRVTEEEYNRCPSWMFEPPAKDDTEMQIERDGIKYIYLRMNWGWGPNYNSTYYLAYSYDAGGSDFAGSYDAVETTYEPTWSVRVANDEYTTVQKIKYLLYGFKNK